MGESKSPDDTGQDLDASTDAFESPDKAANADAPHHAREAINSTKAEAHCK